MQLWKQQTWLIGEAKIADIKSLCQNTEGFLSAFKMCEVDTYIMSAKL